MSSQGREVTEGQNMRVMKEKSNMKTDTLRIKNGKSSLVPTHKVFSGLSAGTITALIVYELHTRVNVDLAPIEASFLTAMSTLRGVGVRPRYPGAILVGMIFERADFENVDGMHSGWLHSIR